MSPTPGDLYLVPSSGRVEVNGLVIGKRDGAAIRGTAVLRVTGSGDAEILPVDAARRLTTRSAALPRI